MLLLFIQCRRKHTSTKEYLLLLQFKEITVIGKSSSFVANVFDVYFSISELSF